MVLTTGTFLRGNLICIVLSDGRYHPLACLWRLRVTGGEGHLKDKFAMLMHQTPWAGSGTNCAVVWKGCFGCLVESRAVDQTVTNPLLTFTSCIPGTLGAALDIVVGVELFRPQLTSAGSLAADTLRRLLPIVSTAITIMRDSNTKINLFTLAVPFYTRLHTLCLIQ